MNRFNVTLNHRAHPLCQNLEMYSDPYLECLIVHTTLTLYHPAGTCKMGPKSDENAVVDAKLR